MTNCRHIDPPVVPTGSAAAPPLFTSHMIERLRTSEHGRWETVLDNWENEGGSVAETYAGQESRPIDAERVARRKSRLPQRHGAVHVLNVPSTSTGASPGDAGQSSNACVCPQCGSPVDRVRRRIVDRLVSWILPVHRYRCRMKGWGCDWEGILRV